jgi:hypothetical protein
MKEFIYDCQNLLSENICDLLNSYWKTITNSIQNKSFNEDKDYCFYNLSYTKIYNFLSKPKQDIYLIINEIKTGLIMNIEIYQQNLLNNEKLLGLNTLNEKISVDIFTVIKFEKYKKNKLTELFHTGFEVSETKKSILVYIIFLNNVDNGGYLDFNGYKISPEKGKLVLFPSEWFLEYKFEIPQSDMYLIMGKIYVDLQ